MSSADRRAQLLELAEVVINEEGVEALTMDGLAVRANIGKPVIYRHFENRDALIVALFEANTIALAAEVDAAIAGCNGDLSCMMQASARAYFNSTKRTGPAMRAALNSSGASGAVAAARRDAFDRATVRWARRFVAHGVAEGDAPAISQFLLAGLLQLSESVARRKLSQSAAERIYVTIANTALESFKS
jgi:AcrR family transcriptional regulator